ncbi:MAG: hypothetical protein HY812_10975 [Planctomycetes bacterium]|nr:hypothetical protein [Planctomycetota bacterium]
MSAALAAALLFSAAAVLPAAEEEAPTTEQVRAAMVKGVQYLLGAQNKDGSWGGVKNATFSSGFANPATYHCWTVGTTALAAQALLQVGKQVGEEERAFVAADRGIDYLVAHARLLRPADWDTDNVWGLIYGETALARAIQHPRYAGGEKEQVLRMAAQAMLEGLRKYQSPRGGWGYYADADSAWRPDWATSFTTAAAVLALVDARAAGLDVDEKMYRAAVRAVEGAHLPSGAYDYSVQAVPDHLRRESINQIKGSLGRIQVGNLALARAGGELRAGDLEWGVEQFFQHHKFLDVARNKPIPHEAYYANAAYFYFFGHYYASQVIASLPAPARVRFAPLLHREIIKCQQQDGSMWDFWIASCARPYGTSFGVMALANTLPLEP